jgi:hypothetical protein
MASVAMNTIIREVAPNQVFPDISKLLSSTATFNQGDLLMYDPVNYIVARLPSEASAASFLGISTVTVSNGNIVSPYSTSNDAAISVPSLNGPMYGVVALAICQTGTSLNPGVAIYASPTTDAGQGVAATGTTIIGTYQGPTVTSTVAGQQIEVLFGSRYPGNTLKM